MIIYILLLAGLVVVGYRLRTDEDGAHLNFGTAVCATLMGAGMIINFVPPDRYRDVACMGAAMLLGLILAELFSPKLKRA